ncbi:MAG TPA: UvrD-helicase domain-containing protein, partial [Acidimicrobiales bacterium]|nr:UvrD-helicase domain-containing protein [Acidimicrobiales bacterium]
MSQTRPNFDLTGPMPGPGVTVLEASAGTGKTYTLAGIVTRLLAEGTCRTGALLVVTFTRSATGELRDRVRGRLLSTYRDLEWSLATGEAPQERLARFLVGTAGDRAGVHRRWSRLSEALADFDRATITTTHGFCHMVLAALGVWGEVAHGASLLEAPEDLVREVCDDLYARWVVMNGPLPFRPGHARTVAGAAIAHPGLEVLPATGNAQLSDDVLRSRLASGARKEMDRRLLDANLLTYDALIYRLAAALEHHERGKEAVARLQERFETVLVDEFQD